MGCTSWCRLGMHKLAIYDLARILPSGPEKKIEASSQEEEAQLQAVHGLSEMVDDDDIGHKKLNKFINFLKMINLLIFFSLELFVPPFYGALLKILFPKIFNLDPV